MPARKRRPDKMRAVQERPLLARIASSEAAVELAAHLLDPARMRPVVVISIPSGYVEPFIDPASVAHALGTLAEVCVVPTNEIIWSLSRTLPEMTQVYGGAGRVYPTGLDWTADYRLSPLRFAYSAVEGPKAGDLLIEDAIGMSARSGLREQAPQARRTVSGTVSALYPPARAIVTVADGSLATVWQELTTAHASIDRVLTEGQHVVGMLDDATGCLIIAGSLRSAADALVDYQVGGVVLVQVSSVVPDAVSVSLYPDVEATIDRAQVTSNELDSLTDLFSTGEVLSARIGARSHLRFELHLDDIDDDDESLVAPALVPGGPPWLEVRDDETVEIAAGALPPVRDQLPAPIMASVLDHENPSAPAHYGGPKPGPAVLVRPTSEPEPRAPSSATARVSSKSGAVQSLSLALDGARARIRALEALSESVALAERTMSVERTLQERRLADAEADFAKATRQLEHERTHRRQAVLGENAARKAQRTTGTCGTGETDLDAFSDPEEQFRHEVYLAWARRIPKEDKPDRPLCAYSLGGGFLGSLTSVDGIARRKVVDVTVEVLTGLAADLDSRELHPLRVNAGGNSGAVVRADGARCWRVAL